VDFEIPKKESKGAFGRECVVEKDLTGKTPERMPLARALEDTIA
jgi:hypothetical protein